MQLTSQAGGQEAGQRWERLSWIQKSLGLKGQDVGTEEESLQRTEQKQKHGGVQLWSQLQ